MLAFLVRRLLTLALTAWLATLVVFAVLEAIPGDPALVMLGTSAQPEAVAALRAQMGLDRPWPVRYAGWVGGMLHGDFGTSLTYARPVAGLVARRLAITPPLPGRAWVRSAGIAHPPGR
ncbi:ABC transporter permease, partial [Azospirillum brasilense]|nr:ABC transporter permease [Azospirillum brasilense]